MDVLNIVLIFLDDIGFVKIDLILFDTKVVLK